MRDATGPRHTPRWKARGRPLVAAALVLALAVVGLPAVAAGDVAPAATRTQADKLVAPTRQNGAEYGSAAAIDGERLVVGEPFRNTSPVPIYTDHGAAYGYDRTGSDWLVTSPRLEKATKADDEQFGWAVAVDGDWAVAGVPGENGDDGAVYVFSWDGSGWALEQRLGAPGTPASARFGSAVDIHGERLIVGAPAYGGTYDEQGIAYVFVRNGSTWEYEDRFSGSDLETEASFGRSVAIEGDRALIGASLADSATGAAFVFARDGSQWSEEARLVPGVTTLMSFGTSVDLCGDTALVGAPYGQRPGSAYAFVRAGATWKQQAELTASDGANQDTFGYEVAVEGDTVIIGAQKDDDKGDASGAAFVFDRDGSSWSERDKLLASDGAASDRLGSSVGMSADTAVIGALGDDNSQGAAYVFDGILGPYNPVEVAGATRYETAIAASQEAFPEGADTVVIATGENWPDALGGAALAGAYDAPILLTLGASVPAPVVTEIDRLGATDAIILGGPGAVSPPVETALASELGATKVRRIGGATRYETAELIARAVESKTGANYDGIAFVATGLNFPDALAGSPLSAAGPWPIFLAPATGLTPSTLATMSDIGVTDVLVLGGTGVVPQAIEDALASGVSGDVTRLAGATRYETAIAAATYGVESAHLRWNGVALATGENFPDALAGGPLQGRKGSVMLLTHTGALTTSTGATLEEHADDIATVRFLGGLGAITQTVRDDVEAILE